MLNMRTEAMEDGEKINENKYDENFKYDDEIEDERISENHRIFLMILFDMLIANEEFDLMQYNEELVKKLGKNVLKNGDYYSFVTHLCQKSLYDMSEVIEKPDTFLEGFMKEVITEESGGAKYKYLTFRIDFLEDNEILENMGNEIVNVHFRNGAQ